MKKFEEKYPNFVSPHKCQVIKLSKHSWRYIFSKYPDFNRNYIISLRDDIKFINLNPNTNTNARIIISNILNKFYNQHL